MIKKPYFLVVLSLSVCVNVVFYQTAFALNNSTDETGDSIYTFDKNLFKGTSINSRLVDRFNRNDEIKEGFYEVDIYVNEKFIKRSNIFFSSDKTACLSSDIIEEIGVLGDSEFKKFRENNSELLGKDKCLTLSKIAKGSNSVFDLSLLRLNITIPQTYLKNTPRDYVDPLNLNPGSSIAFINYTGNFYQTKNKVNDNNYNSAFLSLNGGINLGKWQYRQISNISMNNDHSTTIKNLRSYMQRPIDSLQSKLVIGQQSTSGQFLSGLPFKGLSLITDERMRPDSMRGYAPVIRGLAKSNAKVSIEQNGREIYQITIPAGPFEINDLYPTNFEGNLTVLVTEADGSKSSTIVPYAAVPNSVRAGISNFSIAFGETDLDNSDNTFFSDINYEKGINNNITLNGGLRISNDYQALALGHVYGSSFGALGSNITYSRAKLPKASGNSEIDGWMANLVYSKTFQPTNTTIALAGYRYSTLGYREFSDVLGLQHSFNNGMDWISNSYLQRSRFQINLSQQLGSYGSFYLSGATQNYRDQRSSDTSFQAGYNKSIGPVSLSLNYTRQKIYTINGDSINQERFDNYGGISLNIPLGRDKTYLTPNLNANYNRSNKNDNYQIGINGVLDPDYSLSYDLSVLGNSKVDQTLNAGLYKNFTNGQLGFNTSYNDQYWQNSLNLSGAIAIHSGGITFGPYLGETFALIEAKGAEGAKVVNSPYSKVDRFGYVLVPNISPFRFNNIALDPSNMSNNVELVGGEQRIAPYAGATVKLNFKTRKGYNILVQSKLSNNLVIPTGADVVDENEQVIGMVAQAGQIYVRVPNKTGTLTVRWGEENSSHCKLPYDIDDKKLKQPLIKLKAECNVEN